MLTIEELLIPRVKCLGDWETKSHYPGSPFLPGDILEVCQDGARLLSEKNGKSVEWVRYKNFSHLFKELQWWEERKDNELPKYVKAKNSPRVAILRGIPENESSRWCMYLDQEHIPYDANGFEPATKEEYNNQYIKTNPEK